MKPRLSRLDATGSTWGLAVLALIIVVVVAGVSVVYIGLHRSPTVVPPSGCVTQTISTGSSGACVKDVQTMVDFIETDGLDECPFTDGHPLTISENYDTTTAMQVTAVQTWVNCYNRQEGISQTVPTDGIVNKSTWTVLCTYGYQYPSQNTASSSSYTKAAVDAGKQANCASLF